MRGLWLALILGITASSAAADPLNAVREALARGDRIAAQNLFSALPTSTQQQFAERLGLAAGGTTETTSQDAAGPTSSPDVAPPPEIAPPPEQVVVPPPPPPPSAPPSDGPPETAGLPPPRHIDQGWQPSLELTAQSPLPVVELTNPHGGDPFSSDAGAATSPKPSGSVAGGASTRSSSGFESTAKRGTKLSEQQLRGIDDLLSKENATTEELVEAAKLVAGDEELRDNDPTLATQLRSALSESPLGVTAASTASEYELPRPFRVNIPLVSAAAEKNGASSTGKKESTSPAAVAVKAPPDANGAAGTAVGNPGTPASSAIVGIGPAKSGVSDVTFPRARADARGNVGLRGARLLEALRRARARGRMPASVTAASAGDAVGGVFGLPEWRGLFEDSLPLADADPWVDGAVALALLLFVVKLVSLGLRGWRRRRTGGTS